MPKPPIETIKPIPRCAWATRAPLIQYHDEEWGVPVHDDRTLFEFLILEGAQAGLSWETVLKKRDAYRIAFDSFEVEKIATYGEAKTAELLANPGIIRNRLKVAATITNAQAFLQVQTEWGSFDTYIWQFVGGKPLINRWHDLKKVPASTPLSDQMSKDLRKRGFRFVGTTICYAFIQATGMVDDHLSGCFKGKA